MENSNEPYWTTLKNDSTKVASPSKVRWMSQAKGYTIFCQPDDGSDTLQVKILNEVSNGTE